MSTIQTILLGAIAGFTIYLGLPLGRVRVANLQTRAFLNAASAGILVFLLVEILAHATDPVEHALEAAVEGQAGWGQFTALGLIYAIGFGAGLLSLLYLARLWQRPSRPEPSSIGPGAMSVAEGSCPSRRPSRPRCAPAWRSPPGSGCTTFPEGLAIGQAASSGAMALAALLIIGFGLHNLPEGFGIIGLLAAAGVRASWGWLARVGLIGGGPTFLGTVVGTSFSSTYLFVGCLALAAGALLYVIGELLPVGRHLSWEVTLWGLLAGFLLALATELVLEVAGG